jgi:hypothetical protein
VATAIGSIQFVEASLQYEFDDILMLKKLFARSKNSTSFSVDSVTSSESFKFLMFFLYEVHKTVAKFANCSLMPIVLM